MAVTKKVVKLSFTMDDGSTKNIQLNAAPINDQLVDLNTGNSILQSVFPTLKAAYETDDGLEIKSASVYIISTTTATIESDYSPE